MLVTYVDRCAVCSCSSLRDEGGRRPVPGLSACASGCPCHVAVPAAQQRTSRASVAAAGHDAARFRLFRRTRGALADREPAAR